MTETEHKPMPVAGYTTQKDINIQLVNRNKNIEEAILCIIDELRNNPDVDQRWLATGKTDIEKGFMSVNRAIFKPQRLGAGVVTDGQKEDNKD